MHHHVRYLRSKFTSCALVANVDGGLMGTFLYFASTPGYLALMDRCIANTFTRIAAAREMREVMVKNMGLLDVPTQANIIKRMRGNKTVAGSGLI